MHLPDFISKNRSIHTLLTGDGKKDVANLCFFRALAVNNTRNGKNYEMEAKSLFAKFLEFFRSHMMKEHPNDPLPDFAKKHRRLMGNIRAFPGVDQGLITLCERCFQLDVIIWCLEPADDQEHKARVMRPSLRRFPDHPPMHLLQYLDHFMLIKNHRKFANRFECESCSNIYKSYERYQWHKRRQKNNVCERGETKQNFLGGGAGPKMTIFEEISIQTGIDIPPSLRFNEFRICFDIGRSDV